MNPLPINNAPSEGKSFSELDTNQPEKSTETPSKLDLLFMMDSTGSMSSYITAATDNIAQIVTKIVQSEKIYGENFKIGLIVYRDHPPQDRTFVTKVYPFTSNIETMTAQLREQRAQGGGDGPEAVAAAMHAALNLPWRPDAAKIVVLIADAPPHGLGESGDGFPNGDPNGHDPLVLSDRFLEKGIAIYAVACEPSLSSYKYATDFFSGIAKKTGGLMVPLTSATLLADAIIGGARERLNLEQLFQEVGDDTAKKMAEGASRQEVVKDLYEKLAARGEKTRQLHVDNIYNTSAAADFNVGVYTQSATLAAARGQVKTVSGPRLQAAFAPKSSFSFGSGFSSRTSTTAPPKKVAPTKEARRSMFPFLGKRKSSATKADDDAAFEPFAPAPSYGASSPVVAPAQQVQSVALEEREITMKQVERLVQQATVKLATSEAKKPE